MKLPAFVKQWLPTTADHTPVPTASSSPSTAPTSALSATTSSAPTAAEFEVRVQQTAPWLEPQHDNDALSTLEKVRRDPALVEKLARSAHAYDGACVIPQAAQARRSQNRQAFHIDIEFMSRLTGEVVRRGSAALADNGDVSQLHAIFGGRSAVEGEAARRHEAWQNPTHPMPLPSAMHAHIDASPSLKEAIVRKAFQGEAVGEAVIVDVEADKYHDFHVTVARGDERVTVALDEMGLVSGLHAVRNHRANLS